MAKLKKIICKCGDDITEWVKRAYPNEVTCTAKKKGTVYETT